MSRPRPAWSPPMREGVSASRVSVGPRPPVALLDFLVARLPALARADWQARMQAGEVLDDQGRALGPDAPSVPGQTLWYWRRALGPEPPVPGAPDILFQDAHLLVADKPHGWPMSPKGDWVQNTLLTHLKRCTGLADLSPLHRLDRETAGLVVLALRPEDRGPYQALFRDRQVRKVYEAVAPWHPGDAWPRTVASRLEEDPAAFMQMREVPGSPNAVTLIEAATRLPAAPGAAPDAPALALYRLAPQTGRKHQLRAHMNALGRPLLGDRIYPVLQAATHDFAAEAALPLQLLARALSFTDPLTGQPRHFVSRRHLQAAQTDNASCP